MKRKLINYDVFERMVKDSLSLAEQELNGASPILAKALGINNVKVNCFGANNVLFETTDGFIHANYSLKNKSIVLENVEQLIIDEESEKTKSKEVLNKMLEAVLENQTDTADSLFNDYLKLPSVKRSFTEGKKKKASKPACDDKKDKMCETLTNAIKSAKGLVKEWATLAKNALDYVDFKNHGPSIKDTLVQRDEKGNIIALQIPTSESRVAKKLIDLKWDNMLSTELEVKRNKAKSLAEEVNFCKAISDLKRHNAISDNDGLQETIENIVANWPNVLYLTQSELAEQIKLSLETVGATNYDDQTCEFMAEGILRVAHDSFVDRVKSIVKVAGTEIAADVEDQYEAFQKVVSDLYPRIDETVVTQMQVYVDLYEALRNVYQISTENGIKVQTAGHLNELAAILKKEMPLNVEVVREAAEWLARLVETNLEGSAWTVSNKPHQTVSGDHPAMAQKAKQGYTPASDFSGDWGSEAPVSDGKSYKGDLADEMKNRSWANIANGETWPELSNPYVPKPFGEFTMKGEKGADTAADSTSQWSSGDTWPALQNPYVPQASIPKMNNGKETDLVVEK
jgi:hypothetical protein